MPNPAKSKIFILESLAFLAGNFWRQFPAPAAAAISIASIKTAWNLSRFPMGVNRGQLLFGFGGGRAAQDDFAHGRQAAAKSRGERGGFGAGLFVGDALGGVWCPGFSRFPVGAQTG